MPLSLTHRSLTCCTGRGFSLHWHFWHLVLAATPAALVALFCSQVEPDPDLQLTQNNMTLQNRIDSLEHQVHGGATLEGQADAGTVPHSDTDESRLLLRIEELERKMEALNKKTLEQRPVAERSTVPR